MHMAERKHADRCWAVVASKVAIPNFQAANGVLAQSQVSERLKGELAASNSKTAGTWQTGDTACGCPA